MANIPRAPEYLLVHEHNEPSNPERIHGGACSEGTCPECTIEQMIKKMTRYEDK